MTGVYNVLLDNSPDKALVASFASESQAATPNFPSSDSTLVKVRIMRRNTTPGGRPFIDVDPSTFTSVRFAVGKIGAQPTSGTFTITSSLGGSTSASIAYNASDATVQTALRAMGAGAGLTACTVTSPSTGTWLVDSASTASPSIALTGVASALAPSGSTIVIQKTQPASGTTPGLTNQWRIKLQKALPILNAGAPGVAWDLFPSAGVSPTILTAGSATQCKSYTLAWNADAYDGLIYFTLTIGGTGFTVGPLAYNAGPADIAAAFERTSVVAGDNTVLVGQNGPGDYTVTFIGTNIKYSNTPTLANLANTLKVPKGLSAIITTADAAAEAILDADSTGAATLEIEVSETVDQDRPAVLAAAQFVPVLIEGTPGQDTGVYDWATVGDVRSIMPHTFANAAARALDTPEHVGQFGYQIDTQIWYVALSLVQGGGWISEIGASFVEAGIPGVGAGSVIVWGPSGTNAVTLSVPALTGDRAVSFPDAPGTVVLTTATQTLTNKTLTSPIIANIAPGANFTLTQNSVAALTSVQSGAVVNTLYLTGGKVGVQTTSIVSGFLELPGLTTNSSFKAGSIEIQSFAVNNSWFGDNIYFNGSNFTYRANGYTSLFYFINGGFVYETGVSGTAGGTVTRHGIFSALNTGEIGLGGTQTFGTVTGAYASVGASGGLCVGTANVGTSPGDGVTLTQALRTSYVAKTTTYAIAANDYTVDCTSGSFTVTLPTAVGRAGQIYVIRNSGAGTITEATTSSQTINGAAAGTLAAGVVKQYQSTGANWITLSNS